MKYNSKYVKLGRSYRNKKGQNADPIEIYFFVAIELSSNLLFFIYVCMHENYVLS